MVLVEVRVLCGDYGVLEIGRDLAERNEFVAFRDRECGESRPATCAGCAPRLTVGRSTGRPEGSARQATKQAPHRARAIEQKIGENPCEAGSWCVCLALQSHFRILACGSVAAYA
jgi:hypothetical protein